MSVRILVADDHGMLREGLRALLKAEPDFVLVGEACDGRAAVELASCHPFDVAIMDVRMPDLNGIDATAQILKLRPNAKVIALSAQGDPRSTASMLRAGASAYVLKDSAFEELATAIRTVMKGKVYLSPAIASTVVNGFVNGGVDEVPTPFTLLSPREREVLQLMAEGKGTREIADCLFLSVKTVETHRAHLMEKLRVSTLADVVKYAIREGLVEL